ncbi:MAG: DUF4956 domain-containing protein [Blautia sp.]|nr:DUF4956 domain-containing protein [Blautia sp.]
MTFKDILKKSFIEGYAATEMGTKAILVALGVTALIGIYIFFCYRLLTRRTFYSKNFNMSLIAMSVITAAIILTIQSSVVVSLGMVGALSIVRFRTAIKDPMDLVFLFWSISAGIICGAGLAEIAVILSLAVTVLLFVFDRFPVAKAPMILVINGKSSAETDAFIEKTIQTYCKYYSEKSRAITGDQIDLVIELRVQQGAELTQKLAGAPDIYSVSLLRHDGEVTF